MCATLIKLYIILWIGQTTRIRTQKWVGGGNGATPTLARIRYMCFNLTRRSRCNSSSRCCYRAREHVDPTWSRKIRCGGDVCTLSDANSWGKKISCRAWCVRCEQAETSKMKNHLGCVEWRTSYHQVSRWHVLSFPTRTEQCKTHAADVSPTTWVADMCYPSRRGMNNVKHTRPTCHPISLQTWVSIIKSVELVQLICFANTYL